MIIATGNKILQNKIQIYAKKMNWLVFEKIIVIYQI